MEQSRVVTLSLQKEREIAQGSEGNLGQFSKEEYDISVLLLGATTQSEPLSHYVNLFLYKLGEI